MLAQGAGLFRVDENSRSKREQKELESHPWAARMKRLLHEAGEYGANWVYFRLHSQTGGPRPEIFIFNENEQLSDGVQGKELADLHKQLWNYGAVPLAFFIRPTGVDIFNLMSPPEFDEEGLVIPKPLDQLELTDLETFAVAGAAISGLNKRKTTSWGRFNSEYFDDGGFWDMPANRNLGEADQGALESMVSDMRKVRARLKSELSSISNESERDLLIRRLLIVILMIQFLKERGILPPDYFQENGSGSDVGFLEVLAEPKKLIAALDRLKVDFNGDVFHIDQSIRETIANLTPDDLLPFVNFADPKSEDGQLHFWDRYSFRDLPVEVISYVYEEFLGGKSQSYFTPHHLVDLLLDECMSPEKTQKAFQPGKRTSRQFKVLDPACGSGVFLVGAWKRILEAHFDTGGKTTPSALKSLMVENLHGVDLRPESVELTVFSLSIALCSAFKARKNQPRYLYEKLRELKFPNLKNANIHEGDFFKLRKNLLVQGPRFDVVIGNPPFQACKTEEQERLDLCGDDEDGKRWPRVPGRRLEYLFLRGVMPLVAESGCACLVQPASLIYNSNPKEFRNALFNNWKVPEIFDFTSISQLFTSRTETGNQVSIKTIAMLIEKSEPTFEKPLLHATFRRVSLLGSRKYFEIDPQDLHWTSWDTARANQQVWKANLLGGGRLLDTYTQLTSSGTLEAKIEELKRTREWTCTEGLKGPSDTAIEKYDYRPEYSEWGLLETSGLNSHGLNEEKIQEHKYQWFERPRDARLFQPPHILLKENSSLPMAIRMSGKPLLFRNQIVGISAQREDIKTLEEIYAFLIANRKFVEFFAAFGARFLISKQTAVLMKSLMDLPYPENGKLEFRGIQKHLRDDVIGFMIPLIKDNENTREALGCFASRKELAAYSTVFIKLMRSVYEDLKLVDTFDLGSAWCVAFHRAEKPSKHFDDPEILRDHLDSLLINDQGKSLRCWRVVRHFSDNQIYIVKPKSRRYWLRSTAIRDADEMFAWAMKDVKSTNRRKSDKLKK